ncbi:AraC family ligand binding domain-containing protein [Spirosoma arcticum]
MRPFLLFWIAVLAALPAFPQAIGSNVYSWNHSPVVKQAGYEERILLEGATRDFSHLFIQAVTLVVNPPAQPTQQLDEEALLLIKAGELTLTLGDKRKNLGPGSLVLIMPGDDYRIENKAAQPLTYYIVRYTSNEVPDLDLYRLAGGSFWIDWQEVPATADHQGSTRRMFTGATVMSNRVAVQLTTLDAGLRSYPPHTHRAAEILVLLNHPVEVHIGGKLNRAQVGDVVFVESDVSHAIHTVGNEGSTYFAIQF